MIDGTFLLPPRLRADRLRARGPRSHARSTVPAIALALVPLLAPPATAWSLIGATAQDADVAGDEDPRPFALELSQWATGSLVPAPEDSGAGFPFAESRFALVDGSARFVLSVSGGGGEGLEAAMGLSSPLFVAGPLQLLDASRFLADPAGEGSRLERPDRRPFALDGSLESSRRGLAFGGDFFGAAAWVPPGLPPVLAVWLNAPLGPSAALGFLAQGFGETAPTARSWVDVSAVGADGNALAIAGYASLRGALASVCLALGLTDALRGPESAAARIEAAFRGPVFTLEAAAAARGAGWATPPGRLPAALLVRADLAFEPSDAWKLEARVLSSSRAGFGSAFDVSLGAKAALGAWDFALDLAREGSPADPSRLLLECGAAFERGIFAVSLAARVAAELPELAAGLADAESHVARGSLSAALETGSLDLSAALALELPLAVETPPGVEVSLEASSLLAGGTISASLEFALPAGGGNAAEAAWSVRWKRRVRVGGA